MNQRRPQKPALRSRRLYIVMTLGFGVLAVGAVIVGDAAVAALAGFAAAVTALVVLFAPRISRWINPDQEG